MKIISRKEAKVEGLKRYYTTKPCKHGHVSERRTHDGACCECMRIWTLNWRKENPELSRECQKRHVDKNIDELGVEGFYSARYQKYKEGIKADSAARRFRSVKWADKKAIKDFYAKCPRGYEVDHIIPLIGVMPDGSPVSGLHVLENLQYLPSTVNRKKGNKVQLHEINDLV